MNPALILDYQDYARQRFFATDILVVGTGAGGAAAGAELAEAGFEVTFVEEGSYTPTSSFNPYATESIPRLYRNGGATVIMGRPQIPYVEGRAVGGSTVINGGMTYRPPEKIQRDWERITGSAALGPKGLEPLFEHVEERVQAKYQHETSVGDDSRLMVEGARKKGWHVEVNRRNQDACVGANNCIFGCPTGAKQSVLVSYMPRAMERGARCLTELRIERLIIEGGRCVGVVGRAINPHNRSGDRRVTIRANTVILSCGAIQTPYLLLRHRLARRSKQLGRNFLCHPNAKVLAVYPQEVRAWQGVSQWAQIREFHDEGILFAENFVAPGALAASMPYQGRRAWKLLERYNNMVMSGVLVEDSTTGRVRRGPFGMPIVSYNLTQYDFHRFLRGIRLLSEMHLENGAEFVMLPFTNMHEAHSLDDLKRINADDLKVDHLEPFTVHLMGTARMGTNPAESVVNLNGELWELPGCYVADASLFPTAIAVNPQITIMALATHVARRIMSKRALRKAA